VATIDVEWAAVLSAQRQQELSNPDAPAGSGNDAARLARATRWTRAEFLKVTNLALDDVTPNDQHVVAGVAGISAFLLKFGAMPKSSAADAAWEEFQGLMRGIPVLGSSTTSLYQPTDPDNSGGPPVPDFDRSRFGDQVPNPPGGGGTPRPFSPINFS
jgi:hypothetical protein